MIVGQSPGADSRLYEEKGALYMTLSALHGVEDGHPQSDPISFVLTAHRLVTVRYVTPRPIRVVQNHAHRDPALVHDNMAALHALPPAMGCWAAVCTAWRMRT